MTASSWSFPEREGALAQTASQDLPMLTLADTASRLLVDVIGRTPVPPQSGEQAARDVARLQHQAVWFMAIVATRALGACMAVVTVGYEDQGIGYTRLLTELAAAAEKVVNDHSGEYTQRWLAGKTTTGAKLTGQEFYELVSGPAHADVKAVLDWIAITGDHDDHKVVVGPERLAERANATLVFVAGAARDIAVQLARLRGVNLDLGQLDRDLRAGQDRWMAPAEDPSE
jgi:hypothetical protein